MSTLQFRSVIPLVAVAAIVGCAASTPGAGSGEGATGATPPAKIATIAWPTDVAQVRGLMSRLPSSFDGLGREGPTEQPVRMDPESFAVTGTSFQVLFPDGRRESPGVHASGPSPSALSELIGLLAWSACPEQCPDLQGSPTIMAVMKGLSESTDTPAQGSTDNPSDISPPPTEFLWVSFTLRYGIDSGLSYPPDEQTHMVIWVADRWVYYVAGADASQRDRLVAAAATAVEGPAVVKPFE